MVSPQIDDGYTKIANELLDAICALHLSGSEWSFVHSIIRKTYGYNKKEDWVTNSQIVVMTGLCKERVSEAKKSLIEKNVVTEKRNKISIQKDYTKWIKLRKNVTVVTEKRNKELRKNVNTKDNKDNIQKTLGETSSPELKDKNIDMSGFNRIGEGSDEESTIDFDGDGSVKEEKKKSKAKYPNAPTIRKIFQEVLGLSPFSWKTNKTELIACENLYTERTPEKVRNALEFYKENQEDKFCPQITQPSDLDRKWTKLGAYKLSKD